MSARMLIRRGVMAGSVAPGKQDAGGPPPWRHQAHRRLNSRLRPVAASPSWCAKAHHPRRALPADGRAWMPGRRGRRVNIMAGWYQLWQDVLDENVPALVPLDDALPPLQLMWLRSGPLSLS